MSSQSGGPPAAVQRSPFPKLAIWSTKFSAGNVNTFSGATAGFAAAIATCPLDVIKTKLQAQGAFFNPGLQHKGPPVGDMYRGLVGTARVIIRQDGVRGLYRGITPMLLGYTPTWAVYMTVYRAGSEYFYNHGYGETPGKMFMCRMAAAVMAGCCSTLTTNPIWVIKTRFMSQASRSASDGTKTPWHYSNTMDAARQIYRSEGLAAFYAGLAPAMLGLTHVAIQFPLYEYLKGRFAGLKLGEEPAPNEVQTRQTAWGISAATVISKVCASTATYPHEVLRTRLQTQQRLHPEYAHNGAGEHSQSISSSRRIANTDGVAYQPRYRGLVYTFRTILKEEGWRAFYSGLGTNLVRAVPSAVTTMLTFETVRAAILNLQHEGEVLQGRNSPD